MTLIRSIATLPVLVLALAAGSSLEQDRFTGTWETEIPFVVGRDSATGRPRTAPATARMVLTQEADSVRGSWQIIPPSGGPIPPPRALSGVVSGGRARLTTEATPARVSGPGGESPLMMVTTYDLEVRGDTLAGTQESEAVDGSVRGTPETSPPIASGPESAQIRPIMGNGGLPFLCSA